MDTDDFRRIWEEALAALGNLEGEEGHSRATEQLSRMDEDDIQRLLRDLQAADRDARFVATHVLRWAGERVVGPISDAYATCRNAHRREEMIALLGAWLPDSDKAYETTKLALSDRSKYVRAQACENLGWSLRPEAKALLVVLAREDDPVVREAATQARRELKRDLKSVGRA